MSKSVITNSLLTDIANSIRAKTGSQASMTPAEMADAIDNMSGGGSEHCIEVTLESEGLPSETIKTANFRGMVAVPPYCFYNNTDLTDVTFDGDLKKIGDKAFYGCQKLAMSELPSSVASIGIDAFYNCFNVAFSRLPHGVTTIPQNCFYNCAKVTFSSIPAGVTKIDYNAFYACSKVTFSELPSTITSIGNSAFQGCVLITSMSCNGAITTLGNNLFSHKNWNNVQFVKFPNMKLNALGQSFGMSGSGTYSCVNMTTADIGETKAINQYAFAYCNSLRQLVLRRSDAICSLSNVNAFNNTPFTGYNGLSGTVYVPQALISTYEAATNWSTLVAGGHLTFAAIEGSEFEL